MRKQDLARDTDPLKLKVQWYQFLGQRPLLRLWAFAELLLGPASPAGDLSLQVDPAGP